MKEKLSIVFIIILAVFCLFGCSTDTLKPEDMVMNNNETYNVNTNSESNPATV